MPLTAQELCTRARQIARCPGFTTQSGQTLNMILADLCRNYDFELAKKTATYVFNGTSGPYPLPTDYLRTRKGKLFYIYSGVPYFPTPVELDEYQQLVQQAGFADFPRVFTSDMSQTPPNRYFWPPPSISVAVTDQYYSLMPEIETPESSTEVPWFPDQMYLLNELIGRLCFDTNDDRAGAFLASDEKINPLGSGVILSKFLKLKDDPEGKVQTVEMDRRRFGINFNRLPNTKTIGW